MGNEPTQDMLQPLMEEVKQCEWFFVLGWFSPKQALRQERACVWEMILRSIVQGGEKREKRKGSRQRECYPSWHQYGHMEAQSHWGTLEDSIDRRHLGVFTPAGQGSLAFSLQVPPSPGLTPPYLQPARDLRLPWLEKALSKELQVLSAEATGEARTSVMSTKAMCPAHRQHLPNLQSLPQNIVRPLGYETRALTARAAR